ncbi:hypothetical protein PPERSA_01245 [Pseudocohnilembus persalinus]|uniref:C3H1-type domain-containing protein n=1 Tax=Pseudocohnilembus persalinus TaxID=266149 RepID=A0A0V0QGM3_PSEPJ|nr:hypothetical protein PPERSA_01245 [Pseudocohnilembus persalinus]|eukprot:KRX01342.1 hypothetical protein PPERSA_01245 [Pseudocohnilembus persalinus]
MPPKKNKANQPSKPKVDLTFGVKNKKGASTQKAIKGIKQTEKGMSEARAIELEFQRKEQKKKEAEEKALLASLFNAGGNKVQQKKAVEQEVDPKTLVCQYFKQGLCQKGRKCKFSHDTTLENNKMQQIDLYTDQREQLKFDKFGQPIKDENEETMENWDRNKLEEVVNANQSKYKSQVPTEIVCKYFLNAINANKYGWKWVCPNGMKCHYRHCLPPGYALKKDMKKEKKEDQNDLEARIDEQISNLSNKGQKVTEAVFREWKQKRDKKREEQKEKELKDKVNKIVKHSKGKNYLMTGMAMFKQDPSMFDEQDDGEGADDDIDYKHREYDDDDENKNKNSNNNNNQNQEDNEEENKQEQKEDEQTQKEEISQNDGQQNGNSQQQNEQNQSEEQNEEKKKKKKKTKKSSGDVQIDHDAFLDE